MATVTASLRTETLIAGTWTATDYTDQVLGDITITYGKQDRFEQARAPYAVFTLITGARRIDLDLNTKVSIRLAKTVATQPVFRGYIQSSQSVALSQDVTAVTFTAVGLLGKLAVSEASNIYPSERVSDRTVKVISSGLNNLIIDAIPGNINDNIGTIDNWFNYTINSTNDSPIINVQEVDGEPSNGLSLSNYYAAMALGTVSEVPNLPAPFNQPIPTYYPYSYTSGRSFTLPSEAVYIDQLAINSSNDRIYNYVTLNINDTFAPYTEILWDLPSIQSLGKLEYTINTETPSIIDSKTYAQTFIDDSALDTTTLSGITVRLDLIEDTTLRENLFAIQHGDIITINDIPSSLITSGTFTGKVVGYEFSISAAITELSLYLVKG
jgi:hypothetical protein